MLKFEKYFNNLKFNIIIFLTVGILNGYFKFKYIPKYFKLEILELLIDADLYEVLFLQGELK